MLGPQRSGKTQADDGYESGAGNLLTVQMNYIIIILRQA